MPPTPPGFVFSKFNYAPTKATLVNLIRWAAQGGPFPGHDPKNLPRFVKVWLKGTTDWNTFVFGRPIAIWSDHFVLQLVDPRLIYSRAEDIPAGDPNAPFPRSLRGSGQIAIPYDAIGAIDQIRAASQY